MGDTELTFGQAIAAMKAGKRVQRVGWNGKGMYIYIEKKFCVYPESTHYEPAIVMFTAQGTFQPGWLASQPDILAEDWQIVE